VPISSEQFQEICDGVWRDRATLVKGRGFLSAGAALMRAVYWRLAKGIKPLARGIKPTVSAEDYSTPRTLSSYQLAVCCLLEVYARPRFDGLGVLNELVQRYENEVRRGS